MGKPCSPNKTRKLSALLSVLSEGRDFGLRHNVSPKVPSVTRAFPPTKLRAPGRGPQRVSGTFWAVLRPVAGQSQASPGAAAVPRHRHRRNSLETRFCTPVCLRTEEPPRGGLPPPQAMPRGVRFGNRNYPNHAPGTAAPTTTASISRELGCGLRPLPQEVGCGASPRTQGQAWGSCSPNQLGPRRPCPGPRPSSHARLRCLGLDLPARGSYGGRLRTGRQKSRPVTPKAAPAAPTGPAAETC